MIPLFLLSVYIFSHKGFCHELASISSDGITKRRGRYIDRHATLETNSIVVLYLFDCNSEKGHNYFLIKVLSANIQLFVGICVICGQEKHYRTTPWNTQATPHHDYIHLPSTK